jgi:alpha-glucosidase
MNSLSSPANAQWWQTAVIYQIYPRSYKDTSGNGIGDLEGIISKLDYLNDGTHSEKSNVLPTSLGIDAIWLSPFFPSPMADFGYDVADYCDVDKLFGNLSVFDHLVDKVHKRGMKIIIDYVPNHSSDRHEWFFESRSSLDNPKRNWYIWRDPKPNGALPNNWGSAFGGPAWTLDESSGQYYLHQFLKEQPELNWEEPAVREAMLEVLRFWLDRGVDGFRMDVVGMLIKDSELRDNPTDPSADPDLPDDDIYNRQIHAHNQDQDEVHEVIREFRVLLDQYEKRCAIGEVWYEMPRWIKYYGENGDGLHMPFNFRLMDLPWDADVFQRSVEEMEEALPHFAWPNYVLGSHDAPRLASRIGAPQARTAAMLLLTLRGTPTLYYGDELGMTNGIIPPDDIQDPQGRRFGDQRNRDRGRTPMQWDSSPHAGFSSVKPWLPVASNSKTLNAASQSEAPTSMLSLYRKLIAYRRNSPTLMAGSYRTLKNGQQGCYSYLREHPHGSCLIALNFIDQTVSLTVPEIKKGEIALSTHLDRQGSQSLSNLTLRPHEGLIIEVNA